MRRQDNRWKWPLSAATAVVLLLALVFATPRSWIAALFFPRVPPAPPTAAIPPPPWLELLPPSVIVAKPDIEPQRRPESRPPVAPQPDDAEWWRRAWQLHVDRSGAARPRAPAPAGDGRRPFAPLSGDLRRVARQRPDSSLATRLALMRVTVALDLAALRPRLGGMILGRMYADLKSREADMFDEHLGTRIMTTDGPDEKELDARPPPAR